MLVELSVVEQRYQAVLAVIAEGRTVIEMFYADVSTTASSS